MRIPKEKVIWIPHCVDISRYDSLQGYDGWTSPTFIVMYLGGHTQEYGLDMILGAAEILQRKGKTDVRFLFLGGGSKKLELVSLAQELGLQNVEFRDPVPKDQIEQAMAEADAFVFSRRNLPLFQKYGIGNNKLCDYLASRRPILFACAARNNPVEEAGAGLSVPPQDPAALAEAIEKLMAMQPPPEDRDGAEWFRVRSKVP